MRIQTRPTVVHVLSQLKITTCIFSLRFGKNFEIFTLSLCFLFVFVFVYSGQMHICSLCNSQADSLSSYAKHLVSDNHRIAIKQRRQSKQLQEEQNQRYAEQDIYFMSYLIFVWSALTLGVTALFEESIKNEKPITKCLGLRSRARNLHWTSGPRPVQAWHFMEAMKAITSMPSGQCLGALEILQ